MRKKRANKVEKRNDLNEIRAKHMTMQQLRFFAIYLSRINARDESTRRVCFPLADFQKIMGLGKLNIKNLQAATDSLLCQIVHIPDENGGFRAFQLFKECRVFRDDGAWFVEIDAHDRALPLFFDFKEKYFIYDVGNVLRLSSPNQMRMYEVLKQRQKMMQPVIIKLAELRELLGIDAAAYPEYKFFKIRVLEKAKSELAAQTDITFTYEPIRTGHKITALAFDIKANTANFPQMSIEEWINQIPEPEPLRPSLPQAVAMEAGADTDGSGIDVEFYAEALPEGLSPAEVEALWALAVEHIGEYDNRFDAELEIYNYLQKKTKLMQAQKKAVKPENYFAWLRKAVAEDWQ